MALPDSPNAAQDSKAVNGDRERLEPATFPGTSPNATTISPIDYPAYLCAKRSFVTGNTSKPLRATEFWSAAGLAASCSHLEGRVAVNGDAWL